MLDLSAVGLCGLDIAGRPKYGFGGYTSVGVELLCEALRSPHCMLRVLRLKHSKMAEAEASKLAAAVKAGSAFAPPLEALVIEEFVLPMPLLLGIGTDPEQSALGLQHRGRSAESTKLDTERHQLAPTELRVIADLMQKNRLLCDLCLSGARLRDGVSWLSSAISLGVMPLTKLWLEDNAISVLKGVELVRALAAGAPQLQLLDLSSNPICGVEPAVDGGRDDFSSTCIEALCDLLRGAEGEPCQLSELRLVDVALCGRAKDGNGSYQSQCIGVLVELVGSSDCSLKELDIAGSNMQEEEASLLGKALSKGGELQKLKVDVMLLEPQTLLRGHTLDVSSGGGEFSEIDATLMVQLLLTNTVLTRLDLSGPKMLTREIKVLSDALGRCKFPLRELDVSGRALGLEGCASLLEPLRGCALETLELRRNEICGVKATGREPFSTYVLKIVGEMIAREGGGLRRLNVQDNNLLGNDVYSSDAVALLSEALRSPGCRLQETDNPAALPSASSYYCYHLGPGRGATDNTPQLAFTDNTL